MVKVLVVGDPHGQIDKIRRIPMKGIELILCTRDLGKADLARQRFLKILKGRKKALRN